jgi:mannosyltransferase
VGLITPVYVLLPIVYLLGGLSAFSEQSTSFAFFYGPYLAAALLSIRASMGGRLRIEHLRFTFGAFPAYALAAASAFLRRPTRFRVTAKRPAGPPRLPLRALPTVAAFVATAVAIPIGLMIQRLDARTFTNVSWAVVNLLLLSGIAAVALREMLASTRLGKAAVRLGRVVSSRGRAPALAERSVPFPTPRLVPDLARARPALQIGMLILVALTLRAVLVGTQGLRLDESASLAQAQLPLGELWRLQLGSNVHVPLYHSILHFWLPVGGTSEWALRIPSILMGAAAVPLLYVVGRRLLEPGAAMFAAVLGAVSPFLVWHGYEARMYPLVLLFSLGSLAGLMWAIERGGVWRWATYALITGLSLYTHYFAALMIPVHLAYLLIHRVGRARFLAWIAACGAAVMMFLPWAAALYFARIQGAGLGAFASGVRLPSIDYGVYGVIYAHLYFFSAYLVGYQTVLAAIVVGSWPLVALRVAVSRRLDWLRSRTSLFLATWLVLTVGVVIVANTQKPGLLLPRYLIVAAPPVIFAVAAGMNRLPLPRPAGVGVVVVILSAITVVQAIHPDVPIREDFREAAAILRSETVPGDAIVVMPAYTATPLAYYLRDMELRPVLNPGDSLSEVVTLDIPQIVLDTRGHSLWVVVAELYQRTIDPGGAVVRSLDRAFQRTGAWELGAKMEVRRYRIPVAPFQ